MSGGEGVGGGTHRHRHLRRTGRAPGRGGVQTPYSFADVDRPPPLVHVAEPGEDVGVPGVRRDPQFHGDRTEDVERLGERRGGEGQDVVAGLQGGVVPGADGPAQQGAADRGRRVGRVVAEGERWRALGGPDGQCAIVIPVETPAPLRRHRRPVGQVPPLLTPSHMDAHPGVAQAGRVVAQVGPEPGEGLGEDFRPALLHRGVVRPGPDEQGGLAPGAAQPVVLLERLVEAQVVPAGDQAGRYGRPRTRRTGVRAFPVGVLRIGPGHRLVQERHPAAEAGHVRLAERQRPGDPPEVALQAQPGPRQGEGAPAVVQPADRRDQGALQGERARMARGVEEAVPIVHADLDHHRLQLRGRVGGEGPLRVPQGTGPQRAENAGEPGLPAQPRDGSPAVGGLVLPQGWGTAGPSGAAAALQDDVEALFGEEDAEHRRPRDAAAVRRADQQSGEVTGRAGEVVVGQQRAAVGGGHHESGFAGDVMAPVGHAAQGAPQRPGRQGRLLRGEVVRRRHGASIPGADCSSRRGPYFPYCVRE